MNVLDPWGALLLREHRDAGFQPLPAERRREAVEIRYHVAMTLHQHGRHRIDLGAEVEQPERAESLPLRGVIHLMAVDVGKARDGARWLEPGAVKREGAVPGELLVGGRVGRRPVGKRRRDVDALRRQREVQRLRGSAHREQEPTALDVRAHRSRDGLLQRRHRLESQGARRARLQPHRLDVPRRGALRLVELRELTGEILVMQMQPLVISQPSSQHLGVPDLLVGDPGVLEHHGHRVVPRCGRRWHVHRDVGRLVQRHRIHVTRRHHAPDVDQLTGCHPFERDALERRLALDRGIGVEQETAAAVVQQPFRPPPALQRPEGDAIGLEMVRLLLIHREEHRRVGGAARWRCNGSRWARPADPATGRPTRHHHRGRQRREEVSPVHDRGIASRA